MNTTASWLDVTEFAFNSTANMTANMTVKPAPRIGSAARSDFAFIYQCVLCPIGFIGNIFNLIVLSRFRKGAFNVYLTALSVFDMLFCANLLISAYYRTLQWTESYYFALIYSKTVMPMGALVGGVGTWMTCLIAADRAIHVVFPLKARVLVTGNIAKIIVCVTVFILCILRSPYFFFFTALTGVTSDGVRVYWASIDQFFFTTLGTSLFAAQAIIFEYIPCMILLLLNVVIVFFLYRYRQKRKALLEVKQGSKDADEARRETRLTITLYIVIVSAFIGNIPLNITRLAFPIAYDGVIFKDIASLLFIVDRCSNFFIYFGSNAELRFLLLSLFPCCPESKQFSQMSRTGSVKTPSTRASIRTKPPSLISSNRQSVISRDPPSLTPTPDEKPAIFMVEKTADP